MTIPRRYEYQWHRILAHEEHKAMDKLNDLGKLGYHVVATVESLLILEREVVEG